MASDRNKHPTHHNADYRDTRNEGHDNSTSDYSENFIFGIIILVVVLHICLITIVCYYVCCHKARRRRSGDILQNFGTFGRRHSVDVSFRSPRRSTSNISSGSVVAQPETVDRSPPSDTRADSDTRPITSWQTTFLTRVRGQLGRLSRSGTNPLPPPPYSAGHHADGDGLVNPAMNVEEEHDLPSYDDCLHSPPPWHLEYESDFNEDKPPSYEDVVKNGSET